MSSSRSDDVTSLSVCPVILLSLKTFSAFEARCFEEVTRVFQGCLLEGSRVFQGSFSEESSKGVQVRWKGISSIFNGPLWGLKGIRKRFNRCVR